MDWDGDMVDTTVENDVCVNTSAEGGDPFVVVSVSVVGGEMA